MGRPRSDTKRLRFGQRSIEELLPPETGRLHYYDQKTRHLGVRVEASGRKTFFWQSKVAGRPVFKTIGPFPDVDVEQARGKAEEWSGKLAKWRTNDCAGPNPFERQERGEPTLGELVDTYIEKHVMQHAARPDRAAKDVRWNVARYLARWKTRKLSGIRRKDVLDLHADIGERHGKVTANRVVQLLRRLYYWAAGDGMFTGENPAARIRRFHEDSRTRFLQPDEIQRLFRALEGEPSRDLRDYVRLALFTGARRSDLLSMQWKDVSVNAKREWQWRVPSPKNRTPYVVPLVPQAVKVLSERRGLVGNETNPWVFPGVGKSGHLIDLKRPWKQLLKRAKIDNLRQHDLRRTLGSYQAAQGTSLKIVGASLGHESLAATQVYAQLNLDPVRASVTSAIDTMVAFSKKKPKLLARNA